MAAVPSARQLGALLRSLFPSGEALTAAAMKEPVLRALAFEEVREARADLDGLAGALAEAAVRRGREREVLAALERLFPEERARIRAARGRESVGPRAPIVGVRVLAGLVLALGVGLPWLATWQGVLERPAAVRAEAGPVVVQYRPELVLVPGGRFWMGSTYEERERFEEGLPDSILDAARRGMDDEVRHQAEVGALYVARTEVTLGQWAAVMGTRPNDCRYGCEDEHPVSNVSWDDACGYANRLTEVENEVRRRRGEAELTACYVAEGGSWAWAEEQCTGYRLPTEAEWEHFARAETTTAFWFGDDPKEFCKYGNGWDASGTKAFPELDDREKYGPMLACDDGHGALAPVGEYRANPWGLHDVHGNVWEWVWDWHGAYPMGDTSVDEDDKSVGRDDSVGYKGPSNGAGRVLRGGSFGNGPRGLRAADRDWLEPSDLSPSCGLRVVRVPPRVDR